MKEMLKLTPKDELYFDDVLNQMVELHKRLSEEKKVVKDKDVLKMIDTTCKNLKQQFTNLLTVVEGAQK